MRASTVDKLRFSQGGCNEIQFCNIHRLRRRASVIQSTPDVSSVCSRPIVIKLARVTDGMTLLNLAQDARQHNANVRFHLLLSMQQQKASLLKLAPRCRKIQWKIKDANYNAFMSMVSVYQRNNALWLVVKCKTLACFASVGAYNCLGKRNGYMFQAVWCIYIVFFRYVT